MGFRRLVAFMMQHACQSSDSQKPTPHVEMAGIARLFKKTLKRGTNVVRRVGKVTRKTLRRGTNAVGLTKKRKARRGSRKH
jgi:hypothetical protein